jgi:hypothetical protein
MTMLPAVQFYGSSQILSPGIQGWLEAVLGKDAQQIGIQVQAYSDLLNT